MTVEISRAAVYDDGGLLGGDIPCAPKVTAIRVHCIVPPHMLRVLEMRGDAKQTEMARDAAGAGREDARGARCAQAVRTGGPMLRARGGDAFVAPAFAEAAKTRHLDRAIHDGEGKAALPGKLVRAEGQDPTGDAAADAAYDAAGVVYDLYFKKFDRDSLDGPGHEARRHRPPSPQVQQRLLGRLADGLRRRRRRDLPHLHRAERRRARDEPRGGAVLGRASSTTASRGR